MNILVSACLLGVECRYDGRGVLMSQAEELLSRHHLIPVCPEIMGGLATPGHRRNERVRESLQGMARMSRQRMKKEPGKCLSWHSFTAARQPY